jgi:hypothetical protein
MMIKCPRFHCCHGEMECPAEFAEGIECYKVVPDKPKGKRGSKKGAKRGPRTRG